MAERRHFSEEQIIGVLKRLDGGTKIADLSREINMSVLSCRNQLGA
jgi:hypothetical protein